MTLVFEQAVAGSGTHALIVASGDVPRYPKTGIGTPIQTGRAIANWLIGTFRNPEADLASIEFLASSPREEDIHYAPPGADRSFVLEPPRFETFTTALERWRDRLDAHPGNIAFFYYAGHVFRRPGPDTLLPLQDFAENAPSGGSDVVSFSSLLAAMRGSRCDRHLYIVDGLPLHVGSAVEALQPRSFAAPPPREPAGWVVIHGETPKSRIGALTGFSEAFLNFLDDQAGVSPVRARDIVDRLPARLARADGKVLSVECIGDFAFHYPGLTDSGLESDTDFVADDAEMDRDDLGRAVLAIGLARRLHRIWRRTNESPPPAGRDPRAAFVVHLDAPWGGGKTSFANFVARVLNPGRGPPAQFLAQRYPHADLGGIFLDDPPPDTETATALAKFPDDARRPWIVVSFNAWQAEHCAPPWWAFYQAIRKRCFSAIWAEGDRAWAPQPPRALPLRQARLVRRWRALIDGAEAKARWVYLALREYLWRLVNPKVLSVLLVAVLGSILLVILAWLGVLDGDRLKTWLPILSGGLAGLWGLAAFFTESVAPGTATFAERLSLGMGDPFARFRVHFARMMERVRRPVMVIVDDLDRCRPDFVVDLIRGIQTLLRSPRVVFVILGDRDWVERAFEAHHEAMSRVDVGPEQSFGARFVEKAIQMSFILPALGADRQAAYVRRVLLGDQTGRERPDSAPALEPETAARVRETVNREAAKPTTDPFAATPLVDRVIADERQLGDAAAAALEAQREQVEQIVGEALAIRAVVDDKVEREVTHQLEALSVCFPDNPRQIKRIVNAITVYYAVALQRPGIVPDPPFRLQLALWIIIMTEWPRTWRLLAAFPDLVDLLVEPDAEKARNGMAQRELTLPGSVIATERALAPIRADPELMALIRGTCDPPHPPLTTRSVRTLAQLTPLHSRKRRLPDDVPAAAMIPEGAGS